VICFVTVDVVSDVGDRIFQTTYCMWSELAALNALDDDELLHSFSTAEQGYVIGLHYVMNIPTSSRQTGFKSSVALAQYARKHAVLDLALHARFASGAPFRAYLRWAQSVHVDAVAAAVATRLARVCPVCLAVLRTPHSSACTGCRQRQRGKPPSVQDRARRAGRESEPRAVHQRTLVFMRLARMVMLAAGKRKRGDSVDLPRKKVESENLTLVCPRPNMNER
jgi:hypothetical protein